MKKYLVETVSMFRMRYVIECESAEHANDVVTMGEMEDEFSQLHLDEIITSTREVSDEEYLVMFDKDNDYLKSWSNEKKLSFVNKVNYEKV
jgi:hypothetical protein